MEAYAVIETGGKQYRVVKGNVLDVERLDADEGKNVKIDKVLALSDGKALSVGAPEIKGAHVTAKVLEHLRGKKIYSFKKKRRKGYERKMGHRQDLTKIEIVDLGAKKKAAPKKAKAEEQPAEEKAAE